MTSRTAVCVQEVAAAVEKLKARTDIADISHDSEPHELHFTLHHALSPPIAYSLLCSPLDYPAGTVVMCGEKLSTLSDEPVEQLLKNLIDDEENAGSADNDGSTSVCLQGNELGLDDSATVSRMERRLIDDIREFNRRARLASLFDHCSLRISGVGESADVTLALNIASKGRIDRGHLVCCITLESIPLTDYRKADPPKSISIAFPSYDWGEFVTVEKQLANILRRCLEQRWNTAEHRTNDNIFDVMKETISERLPTLDKFCVVCDSQLQSQGAFLCDGCDVSELFKPWMDARIDDAIYRSTLASEPEIVKLLLTLVGAALSSSRPRLVLEPLDMIVGVIASEGDERANENANKGSHDHTCKKIVQVLQALLTSMDNLVRLAQVDAMAFPLLRWVLSSTNVPSRLVPLEDSVQLGFARTTQQFVLLYESAAKRAAFRAAKEASGGNSVFAFHASPLENWYRGLPRISMYVINEGKIPLHAT